MAERGGNTNEFGTASPARLSRGEALNHYSLDLIEADLMVAQESPLRAR
jgi:hypothetical protein